MELKDRWILFIFAFLVLLTLAMAKGDGIPRVKASPDLREFPPFHMEMSAIRRMEANSVQILPIQSIKE